MRRRSRPRWRGYCRCRGSFFTELHNNAVDLLRTVGVMVVGRLAEPRRGGGVPLGSGALPRASVAREGPS